MTTFHTLLGYAVIALNAYVAVRALFMGRWTETDQSVAVFAHGGLVLQLIVGFFMLSNTQDMSIWHYLAPIFALLAIVGVRLLRGPSRVMAIGGASLLAAIAGMVSYATAAAGG